MKHIKIIILALIVTFSACKQEESNDPGNKENSVNKTEIITELLNAGDSATLVADSIMYVSTVINPDSIEAFYMNEWLSGAKINLLADFIFNAVYNKRLKPYSYITGEEMTIQEIEELEKEWKREEIGQILFTEDWYFDEKKLKMYKQVNSVMLAYNKYDDNGFVKGYKSGIRVYLNGTKPMKGAVDY